MSYPPFHIALLYYKFLILGNTLGLMLKIGILALKKVYTEVYTFIFHKYSTTTLKQLQHLKH